MRLLHSSLLCVLFATLLCAATIAQQPSPAMRIVNPIDEKQLVTLKGTLHPLANAVNDRGVAPDEMRLDRIHLVLKRSDSQEAALRTLITQMHSPGTADYHKWLTPDAFGKQFGPADEDIAVVKTWLGSHGFSVIKLNPGKQTLEFSGNVAQFRSAFHTQVHRYQVNGQTHYASAADPQIPAALSPVIGGFVSLNNFPAKSYVKYLGKAQYDPKTGKAVPEWTVGGGSQGFNYVLAPQDFAVQYDLNPLYTAGTNGTGQTIAIINESNINIAAVNNFRSLFGLPANPPQVIIDGNDPGVDGVNNPDGPNGASVEAYLDVEWSGAVAPNATIDLVIGADTALESGLILAAEHTVYNNVAPVASLSFGACESIVGSSEDQFLNGLWEQAAAQGMTVMVSSGDSGSAGCDNDDTQEYAVRGLGVNGFGSTPYNVSVGGTDFYYSDFSQGLTSLEAQMGTYWSNTTSNNTPVVSIKGVIPEQPWNDSQYAPTYATLEQGASPSSTTIAAGSGGASALYTKPAWQSGTGVPADGQRDLPDVSLFASNGVNLTYYPICAVDGDCQPVPSSGSVQFSGVGGTSASSPAFAGIMALVNQKYGPQGQANFVLYPLASQFPAAFHDVANGTNSVPCQSGSTNCIAVTNPVSIVDPDTGLLVTEGQIGTGTTPDYNAAAGYDLASGLGTIDANQLVANWGSVNFASTITTLAPSSTSFTHGTNVTISGGVTASSGVPTGDVALMTSSPEQASLGTSYSYDYPTEPLVFILNNGSYSNGVSTLPGGTYNIWGNYSGDSQNAASASTPVSITVTPESSGVYFLARSPAGFVGFQGQPVSGTVDYGTQLMLSAEVVPSSILSTLENSEIGSIGGFTFGKPTGTVAFADNGTPLNTAALNAEGDAEYNAPYAIGTHSVTASYSGDNSYTASAAAAITFTVGKDTPNIFLGASNQVSSQTYFEVVGGTGQPTIFNILVENGAQTSASGIGRRVPVAAPTGTIYLGGFPAGVPTTATLSAGLNPSSGAVAGIATVTLPANTPTGLYGVSVGYSGDANYVALAPETAALEIVSAGLTASTTTAAATGTISPTTSILVTGTVTGSGTKAPTGSVYAYSSGNYIAGVSVTPGNSDASTFSIVLNSQDLIPGANFVNLQYFGDKSYAPSAFALSAPIANPLTDFTLTASSAVVQVMPGGTGASSINLASINGFTGAVNLTCSATPGVTCTIPSAQTLVSGGSALAVASISVASSTAGGNYSVLVTGSDSTGKYIHTVGIRVVVSSIAPGFSLANSGSISIGAGATTGNTSTISILPSNGFTGAINLSCLVTTHPTGATSTITCNIPPSVSITGTSATTASITAGSTATTAQGAYAIQVTGKDATTGKITSITVVPVTVTGVYANVKVTPSLTTFSTETGFTVTATVTGAEATPTGSVNLYGIYGGNPSNGASFGGGPLVNGTFTFTVPAGEMYGGIDTIYVVYGGDSTYAPETGTATVTVTLLTPTIAITPPTSIYTNQSLTINGGLTGTATGPIPTGNLTLTGGGASVGSIVDPDGGFSFIIPPGSLSAGTDALTITYIGDHIYGSVIGSTSVIVMPFVPLTPSVTVTPPSTNVDTGVNMNVAIAVTGASGTPTGTVTLSGGGYNSTQATLASGAWTFTIPPNTLSAGSNTLTASYSGDSTYTAATGSTTFTVTQSAFSVAASAPASISPGGTATSTITVSSTTGYDGSVSLGCTLTTSPTGATDLPTCTAGTGTINLTSAVPSGTATVTVTTTGSSTSMVTPNFPSKRKGLAGATGGVLVALLVFLGVPGRRRAWRSMLGMLALLTVLASLAACGGGGSSGGGGGGTTNPGTTAGTYTFTVTATGSPAQSSGNTTTFTVTIY